MHLRLDRINCSKTWLRTTKRDVISDIKNDENNVAHNETKQKTVDSKPGELVEDPVYLYKITLYYTECRVFLSNARKRLNFNKAVWSRRS